MKIKSLITLIILLSFSTYSQAWAACLIKNKPAPALSEYIKNNRVVIKNVTNEIIKQKNKKDTENIKEKNNSSKFQQLKKETAEDYNNVSAETASIFNEIFNFKWYYSYFTYYVTYPIFNEVPFEVKRDHSVLDSEWKWMTEYLKKINQNWESDFIITNPCKWITKWLEKCEKELNNQKSIKIIWKLIKNNDKILDLYRSSVTWEDEDYDIEDFILIDEDLIDQIQFEYYSEIAVWECNKEKWGFFERISTAISDIKLINKKWEDWIKKWKDAFALLLWNAPDWEEDKIAQKKLKEYLSESWIPSDKQEIIMKNLADTDSDPFSLNNNFIENTFSSTIKKVKKDLALWKKQNIWDAIPKDTKKVSNDSIKKITDTSEITRNIEQTIDELYEKELPFIWVWNITTESLRAKIINSHIQIQNSVDILENTIEISQKVCRSQWWGWKCD